MARVSLNALCLALPAALLTGAGSAGAAQRSANDVCALYGYAPGSRAHAECRMNVRHYWSSGPCAEGRFAALHPRYCHTVPTIDF